MKGPPTTHGPRMPIEYWIQLGSPVFSCHKDKTKAVFKLFKHIKYTKGPYCADIRTVTLLKHGNVLIACCVLQVTVKGFTKWDNAYVGNLPVGPSLQMACDDNLLVFCSEINNRADCIDDMVWWCAWAWRDIEVIVYLNSRWFVAPLWEYAKIDWIYKSKSAYEHSL